MCPRGHGLRGRDVQDDEEDIQRELQGGRRAGGREGAGDALAGGSQARREPVACRCMEGRVTCVNISDLMAEYLQHS